MMKLYFYLLLFAAAFIIQSCSPYITVPVTWPNKINLKEFKGVYVGDYGNLPGDKELHDHLIMYLRDTCKLNVLDSAKFEEAVRANKVKPGESVQKNDNTKPEDDLKSVAVISTNVVFYKYAEKERYRDIWGKAASYTAYKGQSRVEAYFKVKDLATEKVVFFRSFLAKSSDYQGSYKHGSTAFEPDELFFLARELAIKKFTMHTMPFSDTLEYYFFTTSDLPELKEGGELISKGRYEEAIKIIQSAAEKAKDNETAAKAYYDLGLACRFSFSFDKASEAYAKACSLSKEQIYIDAALSCKIMEADERKSEIPVDGTIK